MTRPARLKHEKNLGGFLIGVDNSNCVVIERRYQDGTVTTLTVVDVDRTIQALKDARTLARIEEERA